MIRPFYVYCDGGDLLGGDECCDVGVLELDLVLVHCYYYLNHFEKQEKQLRV